MSTSSIIPRQAFSVLESALSDTPIVAINGPRQVGKSTLAAELLQRRGGHLVTLDDETQMRAAASDPRGFVERSTATGPLVIDEVQLVPSLFRALKAAVDRDRSPGRFVVTGSTRLLSAEGFAEALVGRIEIVEVWPFTQGELVGGPDRFIDWAFSADRSAIESSNLSKMDYAKVVALGGFPEAVTRSGARRGRWFDAYVTTLVTQVAKQVSGVERASELPRLVRLLAARSGTELNVTGLANELGIPARTVDGYVALVTNTFIAQLLPAWSTNVSKKVIRRPKMVMADSGLASHLVGFTPDHVDDPYAPFGQLLEGFVAMELRKQLEWAAVSPTLSHFRDRDGAEVDLVLEHPDGRVVGIEVKAARSVSDRDIRGLRFLADRVGPRFHAGVVLSCMPEVTPLGDRLMALPIDALWRVSPAGAD